jgi:hypothetical protein
MRNLLIVLSLGVLLPACVHRSSQDDWTQQVRDQLRAGGGTLEARGYSLAQRITTGSLDDGERVTHEFQFERGKDYHIMGACDTDCSDLDLTLYDGSGNEVAEDVAADDVPIVSASATRSGKYSVRVYMANCDVEPCRYGFAIYGK